MRRIWLFVSILCFLLPGCNVILDGELISASSEITECSARAVTSSFSNANKLVFSVTPGEFINKITVFAFYNRNNSGTDGYDIHYETWCDGETERPVTERSPAYPVKGIEVTESQTIKAAVFQGGQVVTQKSAAYKKIAVERAPVDPGCGVMLQCFNWGSANSQRNWYRVVTSHAPQIKQDFDFAWFPPPSQSHETAAQGYAPTELNNLNSLYGSEDDLRNAISSLKPVTVLADIVVNHRNGSSDWADFCNPQWTADYASICCDDAFFQSGKPGEHFTGQKGARSTGELFPAFRNLDHTNPAVQAGIVSWMNSTLFRAGFSGWRYDYVKGFDAEYAGFYTAESQPVFSVGEYWPSSDYQSGDSTGWGRSINQWLIKATQNSGPGQQMYAFDFVVKGTLNSLADAVTSTNATAKASVDFSELATTQFVYRLSQGHSVTFVDNHDTGSTQHHWPLQPAFLDTAYAFILMSPGVPCVFWDQYFSADNAQLQTCITQLISLRKEADVQYNSAEDIICSQPNAYAARISGKKADVILKIGSGAVYSDNAEPHRRAVEIINSNLPVYAGSRFAVWLVTDKSVNQPTGNLKQISWTPESSWNECYVHCWNSADNRVYTSWPGLRMEKNGTGFTAKIPGACNAVVFNNGTGAQTADIHIE